MDKYVINKCPTPDISAHRFLHGFVHGERYTTRMLSLTLGVVGLPMYRYKRHIDLPPGFNLLKPAGYMMHQQV
jgi:hypothetical protein